MAHPPRMDAEGRWFHVMNRGIARRLVFRGKADIRYFLSRLARSVRRGDIEVHAYCVMTTHFHLLVRSPVRRLSEALRRIQNEYVRYFNRANRRDGPLFRGRFRSRPVLTLRYRAILFPYIDDNPMVARLVDRPADYPWGSAARYAGRRPPWLATWWVDEVVAMARRTDPGATYTSLLGRPPSASERALVRARLRRRSPAGDPLDDLLRAAPAQVLAWLLRKAALADGLAPGLPVVDAQTILDVVAREEAIRGTWSVQGARGRPMDLWPIAKSALLRELAALTHVASAAHLGVEPPHVGKRVARHRQMIADPAYAARAADPARHASEPPTPAPTRSLASPHRIQDRDRPDTNAPELSALRHPEA